MRRYLILTPIRGLKADADGTVGADQLGGDIDSLVAIGAIEATGEPDDVMADADGPDFVDAFLDRFVGEPEPATAMVTVLQAAMEGRGWWPPKLIFDADDEDESGAGFVREMETWAAEAEAPVDTTQSGPGEANEQPADGEPADALRDALHDALDDGAVSKRAVIALPEVSDRLTKAQLLEIAAAEGVTIETDANKAAIVHAIECSRKGEAHAS